jgi:hypothetical protein
MLSKTSQAPSIKKMTLLACFRRAILLQKYSAEYAASLADVTV